MKISMHSMRVAMWFACLSALCACRDVLLSRDTSDAGTDVVDVVSDTMLRDMAIDTPLDVGSMNDAHDAARATDVYRGDASGPAGSSCVAASDCVSDLCLSTGVCAPTCSDPGDCIPGWHCQIAAGATSGACACSPSAELCDGLDNDCDGHVDFEGPSSCVVNRVCVRGRCECLPGLTDCDDYCTTLNTHHDCGACHAACDFSHQCIGGVCACAVGEVTCGTVCTNLRTSGDHCGRCDNACAPGDQCNDGVCGCPPSTPDRCSGVCVSLSNDALNCGSCGNRCPLTDECQSGVCVCRFGGVHCGASCVDSRTDIMNCGACGNVCPTGATCSAGVCVCPAGRSTVCGGACTSLISDPSNCGTCGVACPTNCDTGACITAVQISAQLCAVLSTGSVRCPVSGVPVAVPGITLGVEVESGLLTSCARLTDGTVRCWGSDLVGQLGDGPPDSSGRTPVTPVGLIDAVQITVGWRHACARTRAGAIYCWGGSDHGQVGDGTFSNHDVPTLITLPPATTIAAGDDHTCALAGGQTYCWGRNDVGQLGDGTTIDRSTPTLIATPVAFESLAAGTSVTCALSGGQLYWWGNDPVMVAPRTPTPALVSFGEPIAEISSFGTQVSARLVDGRVYRWDLLPMTYRPNPSAPFRAGGLTGAVQVAGGFVLDGTGATWRAATDGSVSRVWP